MKRGLEASNEVSHSIPIASWQLLHSRTFASDATAAVDIAVRPWGSSIRNEGRERRLTSG
jgi:hypothetical protein